MSDFNNLEIRIFASPRVSAGRDLQEQPQIAAIIRNQLLPQTTALYYRVDVKVKRNADQTPRYLVAYLLRRDIYLAEVARIDVDRNFQVTSIRMGYDESEEDDDEAEPATVQKPAYGYDFVAATPVPDIPTAKDAVEKVCAAATKAGLTCKMLLGKEATVANYQLYLRSGLKGFVNVGHGTPNGIILDDGTLAATWFSSMADQAIKPAVVYFNSCQVHNDPLKAAVMKAGTQTYIGGIINLLIGPSEEVCKCFWNKTLTAATPMGDTLRQCEKDNYPTQGAHGISGNLGPFVIVKGGPSMLAYEQFMFTDQKQYSANANVASVTFTLPQEMFVTFVAESSATIVRGNGPQSFVTGLYNSDSPNTVWTASYRTGSCPGVNQHVPVHTAFAMKLPAGTHTMYWKIWVNGYTLQLGSGTLTALAMPCSMGGQLREGVAEAVADTEVRITTRDPAQPNLFITIDRPVTTA